MSSCCGETERREPDGRYRRVLWAALVINATMFLVEVVAGLSAQSDALDFLGDAANYGMSLFVLGMALRWRSGAALLKGASMGLFGLWVIGNTIANIIAGSVPEPLTMGWVGGLALAANVTVAGLLYAFREGDSNMRSVWLCSRNDAIGNVAVMLAALGVIGTGTAWPDLGVASVMAALGLTAAWQVIRQARAELRGLAPKGRISAALSG
jgi:Co/Zn/Cd efflux system component